jgi:hypothetical protein
MTISDITISYDSSVSPKSDADTYKLYIPNLFDISDIKPNISRF